MMHLVPAMMHLVPGDGPAATLPRGSAMMAQTLDDDRKGTRCIITLTPDDDWSLGCAILHLPSGDDRLRGPSGSWYPAPGALTGAPALTPERAGAYLPLAFRAPSGYDASRSQESPHTALLGPFRATKEYWTQA